MSTSDSNPSLIRGLIKLARPHQWVKGGFVLIGPAFAFADGKLAGQEWSHVVLETTLAFVAFCFAASGCYVFNDLADVERDRLHPRKKHRPIAAGVVSERIARAFGFILLGVSLIAGVSIPSDLRWWVIGLVVMYIANVTVYSAWFKHIVIIDVLCLSTGFVLRVLGGCAAVGVTPSTWLLNATLFLSMFLAFGKRLGERRTMGTDDAAAATRGVQQHYTDQTLRMIVVVTGVATLLTYTGYVQSKELQTTVTLMDSASGGFGFNLLWITVLPAMLGLLRTITMIMSGRFDDPTELALRDPVVRWSACSFVMISGIVLGIPWNS